MRLLTRFGRPLLFAVIVLHIAAYVARADTQCNGGSCPRPSQVQPYVTQAILTQHNAQLVQMRPAVIYLRRVHTVRAGKVIPCVIPRLNWQSRRCGPS